MLDFLGEKRGFDWIRLDAALLPAPVAAPTDAELEAEHDAHHDRYTRPETRRITTASITPDALAATIEIPEDELRAAYDADLASYQTPERRVADRIGFRDAEAAAAAKARLDAGEIDFDALAAERGLTPEDIDQGFVTADELPGRRPRRRSSAPRARASSARSTPPLGPSLYRINAILAATTTPFEEARRRARARAAPAPRPSGASTRTPPTSRTCSPAAPPPRRSPPRRVLEPGTLALDASTTGGLADDPAFRDRGAEAAEVGVETDLIALAGGGLATLRVDAHRPAGAAAPRRGARPRRRRLDRRRAPPRR